MNKYIGYSYIQVVKNKHMDYYYYCYLFGCGTHQYAVYENIEQYQNLEEKKTFQLRISTYTSFDSYLFSIFQKYICECVSWEKIYEKKNEN